MLFILKVLEGAVQSTMGAYQQDRSRPPLAHFAPPLDLSSVFNSHVRLLPSGPLSSRLPPHKPFSPLCQPGSMPSLNVCFIKSFFFHVYMYDLFIFFHNYIFIILC